MPTTGRWARWASASFERRGPDAGDIGAMPCHPALLALSNDSRKNLQEPLAGIREQLRAMGLRDPGIRGALRRTAKAAFTS